MKIREAKESDLPAMVEIYNASVRGGVVSTNTRPATVARSTGWFRQHKAAGKPVLVAEEEGKVVGWLSLRPFYRRPAYDATAKVMIYVMPEARGKGVGKELLSSAISCGKSAGLNTLICYLLSDNVPAQRLFEDSGFKKWGHFPGVASMGGTERDLVVMGRRI
jgi:L-amino acid N-acyltransferase YncA